MPYTCQTHGHTHGIHMARFNHKNGSLPSPQSFRPQDRRCLVSQLATIRQLDSKLLYGISYPTLTTMVCHFLPARH